MGGAAVGAMLEVAMEELFVPYMEGTRYLDKEAKSVTELYASKLLRFTNWHVSPMFCNPYFRHSILTIAYSNSER